jgi:uncharacterized protein (TIGR02145 family)
MAGSLIIMNISCNKSSDNNPTAPVLTTVAPAYITQTTAISGGVVSSDGGATVTERGICWSTNPLPTIQNSKTIDLSGSGSTYASALTGLTAGMLYYVAAYAQNSAGTSYGKILSFTSTNESSGTVTDVDGNIYHPVVIGTQVWLRENLMVKKYRNGDAITNVTDNTEWNAQTAGAYCDYMNIETNSALYGRLYNFYAVIDTRGICPVGWHIASNDEWTILFNYLGGLDVAGGKMKEPGISHWTTPNDGATNESGFLGLPSGFRTFNGFSGVGKFENFWTSTENDATTAWDYYIKNINAIAVKNSIEKFYGFSVRCIKD